MINLFRIYNPINIVWLAFVVLVMRLGYIINAPDHLDFIFVESFTRSLVPVAYENAFSPAVNIILAAALVFGQAIIFNYLINFYNLLGKPSFLPALMYVVASSLFTPFLMLSPPLICNFLILWMLFKLFGLYKTDNAKSAAYDLGMIVAVGSLIYLPFVYLMLVVWLALMLFRPFDIRDWIASVFGYVTVFFFLAVYYYLNNRLQTFYTIWLPLGTRFPNSIHINQWNYLILVPVLLIFVLCFFKIQQIFYKSYVQIRKSYQLLLLLFIVAGLAFYVKEFRLSHFLLCVVPTAVFFAYYFLYATKRWFYELLFVLLVGSIIYFQFNTF